MAMPLPPICNEVPMSLREDSQYIRTHQYAAGSGRAHQAVSPEASHHRDESLQMTPFDPSAHRFPEGEFVPVGFFEQVNSRLFDILDPAQDWRYPMRREAQKILPFLYLGPWACVKDRNWLRLEGLTLLLAVRDRRLALARLVSGEKVASELGIEADTVDISNNQELISILPYAIRRINEHLFTYSMMNPGQSPKIFVFCETGSGLSAVLIIAYLMVMFNADSGQAIQAVHIHRFCIETDEESRILLRSFEAILEAKRDVELTRRATRTCSSLSVAQRATSRKRDMDYRQEDDAMGDSMDMDIEKDALRRPLSPFQDR
ncbi:hypothetical protein BDV59DRAFT_173378 [Aspergillus ambiguus]|uniref:dual specificity protein phosphatase family protein n=1 Tax=Aspergillus ambiguus TaxID=176160 RepID=UPI003CCCB1D8